MRQAAAVPRDRSGIVLWPLAVLIWLLFVKIFLLIDSTVIADYYDDLFWRVVMRTVFGDLWLLLLAATISLALPPDAYRISKWLLLLLIVVYWADTMVIAHLYVRLTIPNIVRYYSEVDAIRSFLSWRDIIIVATALSIFLLSRRRSIQFPVRRTWLLSLFASVLGVSTLLADHERLDPAVDQATHNILRVTIDTPIRRSVDEAAVAAVRLQYPDIANGFDALVAGSDIDRTSPPTEPPNVIVLVSESLSQVDSVRSGGLFDRIPAIDSILRSGITLTNLVANGSNTADALAALLLGIQPAPTPILSGGMPSRFPPGALEGRNIVQHANERGYFTFAATNAPLAFEQTGQWFAAMGFDHVVGNGSGIFRNEKRYTFGSPGDEALYRHTLQLLRSVQEPFLGVLLTISLHKPYSSPRQALAVPGNPFLSALRYVDVTTREFYEELNRSGFFDNGILVLVGDHRRMGPLEAEENALRGVDALGRVVAGYVGAGIKPAVIDSPLNHTDLNDFLHRLLSGVPASAAARRPSTRSRLLGNLDPFSIHAVDEDKGIFLVRHADTAPTLMRLREPDAARYNRDSELARIRAYLKVNTRWLEDRQQDARREANNALEQPLSSR